MKILIAFACGLLVAFGANWALKNYCPMCHLDMASAAVVGEKAPVFSLKNQNDDIISLEELMAQKQPIVLEWYNKDCPYVRKFYSVGEMQRLQKEYTQKGVIWLRVVSSAPGKQGYLTAAEAAADHKASFATHTLLDPTGSVGRLYGAKVTPHMMIIGSSGVLAYRGAIDSVRSFNGKDIAGAQNYVTAVLDALATNSPLPAQQTEAYGCSIKY